MPSRRSAACRAVHLTQCLCLAVGLAGYAPSVGAVAPAEVVSTINALRAGGCRGPKRAPLSRDERLQSAVQRIASGSNPQAAFAAAEYQAKHMSSIHLTGYDDAAELRALLKQKYCDLLLDAKWQEVGVAQRAVELWIVLAMPQLLPTDTGAVLQQALTLVNAARARERRCGAQLFAATTPVKPNRVLNKAAQVHADDMARHGQMDHTGSDSSTPAQRITRQGYRWKIVGENVAAGPGSAEEVVNGWLQSPGHCANIMSPAFAEMGLAFAINRRDQYAVYWAQSFATPR